MTLSHGFRRLATVLESIESNGMQVLDVATTDDEATDRLTVDLTFAVPLDASESVRSPLTNGDSHETAASEETGTERTERSAQVLSEEVLDPLSVRTDATNGATATATPDEAPADQQSSDEEQSSDEGITDERAGDDQGPTDEPGNGSPTAESSDAGSTRADPAETEAAPEDDTEEESNADADVVHCPVADCDGSFESEHGMKIHRTKIHGCDDESDGQDRPAYRDPDRLREVYASCDSFTEMRDELGTDVSAQTVRRQMIAHDIYDPEGTDTATEAESPDDGDGGADTGGDTAGDDGAPTADSEDTSDESDSSRRLERETIELPEGVTVADLETAVSEAKTLYDVQQRFDIDREEAMQLLEKYELLDVVHGRVADRDRRKRVDEDEIRRRILEHAPVSRAPKV